MKTLAAVKRDIEFNKGLSSLIEVLKSIAVSQYRALEKRLKTYGDFLAQAESFLDFVDITNVSHPFMRAKEGSTQAVIAVTSDSGLLGGLNLRVVNAAIRELEKIPGQLIVVGERGKVYVRDTGIPFTAFGGIKDEERFEQAMQLRDYAVGKIIDGSVGHLKIIYPKPISFTVQRVEVVSFLPYERSVQKEEPTVPLSNIIFESPLEDVLEYLVYLWIGQKIYEIFGLSRLSEFAARFVHLEESANRLKEVDSKTRLEYFRLRHEIIDRNMRELFAARLLFMSK